MIQQVLATLAFASLIAFINERIVELRIAKQLAGTKYEEWIDTIAFVMGFAISLFLGIDFVTPLAASFGIDILYDWSGYLVSALAVGGGSNLIHDIVAYVQAVKLSKQASARMQQLFYAERVRQDGSE